MKDYAAYIWPAYLITGAVFAILTVSSLAHARRWRARAERDQSQETRSK